MKKSVLIMILTMLLFSTGVYAYTDVDSNADYAGAVDRLHTLGVLNGYEDGTFRPYDHITREEFAKVIVCALDREADAMSTGYVSSFYDVTQDGWAVPYINYVANGGIVTGYADGSYGPNNNITYAEAATIILRMMGYAESDLGYFWPNNYVNKANSMLLANSVVADYNAVLSRATVAVMIDNALFGDVNEKAQGRTNNLGLNYVKDKTLLEAIGFKKQDDVFIVATKKEDSNLSANKVRTSIGTYELLSELDLDGIGKIGTAVISKDDKLALFIPSEFSSMTVIVDRVTGNILEYTMLSGSKGVISLENGFTIYDNYEKSSYQLVTSKLTQGSTLTLYSDSGDGWGFATLDDTTSNIIPVVATHKYYGDETSIEGMPIDNTSIKVYRDQEYATLSDIEENDVIYYNKGANIAEVYSVKVTGIYYEAKPSKAYVESVVIGNVEYKIGTTTAKSKLDATASAYEIGSRITLLLGKEDEIVSVIPAGMEMQSGEYGVVINTYIDSDKTGAEKYVAKILTGEGQNIEVITEKDYLDLKGKLINISYNSSGLGKLNVINSTDIYGTVDKASGKIGNKTIGDKTIIMELVSNNDGIDAKVEILDFGLIDETKLSKDKVLGVVTNDKFGDVSILYVENWTDVSKNFGIVTKVVNSTSEYDTLSTVTIYTNGAQKTYRTAYSTKTGNPVMFKDDKGTIALLQNLNLVKAGKVEASEMGRIKISGKVYETSKNVEIVAYDTLTRECRSLSFAQLENKKVEIYTNSGSDLIKVIVVNE